jgi:transposase
LRLATVSISENFRGGVDIEDGFYIGPTFIIRTSPPAIVVVVDADFHAGGVDFALTEFSEVRSAAVLPHRRSYSGYWGQRWRKCYAELPPGKATVRLRKNNHREEVMDKETNLVGREAALQNKQQREQMTREWKEDRERTKEEREESKQMRKEAREEGKQIRKEAWEERKR